jgi:hypothetical protein
MVHPASTVRRRAAERGRRVPRACGAFMSRASSPHRRPGRVPPSNWEADMDTDKLSHIVTPDITIYDHGSISSPRRVKCGVTKHDQLDKHMESLRFSGFLPEYSIL